MLKTAKIILVLLVTSIFVYGQSDDLVIRLKSVQKSARITTMTIIYDINNTNYDSLIAYKGIPGNINSYIIKTLDFQPEQSLYEQYLRYHGEMPVDALTQGLKLYNFLIKDTIKLSRIPIKHFVSFLVGRNNKGQVIIIGDANNNYNFGDDKPFVFDSSIINSATISAEHMGVNNFHYQYSYNGKIIDNSVFLGMKFKYSSFRYTDPAEQKFFLAVSLEEYKMGMLKTKDTSLSVKMVFARFPSAFYNNANSKIFFNANDENQYYVAGDTFYLKNKKYLVKHIAFSGDTLYLSYLGKEKKSYNIYPGDYAYNIMSSDLLTNIPFNLNELKGKYVLLDFWGSWCSPCIESIPELVKFSQKYKTRLQVVSIAEEYKNNTDLLKTLIRDNSMQWIHLFENLKDTSKNSIAVRYKIEFYPTQILINPEGKIIYRSTTKSKLSSHKMDSLLKQ